MDDEACCGSPQAALKLHQVLFDMDEKKKGAECMEVFGCY